MRIVVAMSGGVDSSVTAGLLVEAGHEVIGVHMKLHDRPDGDAGHCCGLDDARNARRVAARLDIPFYVMDLKEAFKAAVMDKLVSSYLGGMTPNPCVACNGVLKFQVLLGRAVALGAEKLATGHYARTDGARLFVAADAAKDQTYFLYPISAKALARTLFPLGGLTKPEVREHARRMGLLNADKPESMEVCFLPDDDHTRFVAEAAPEVEAAGDIVDETGKVLGHHDAWFRYTVGQRRGLGLGGGPWYVLRIEPDARQVVVGPAERLESQGLEANLPHFLAPLAVGEMVEARLRHRGARIPAQIRNLEPLRLAFDAPARAVAPGQAVVLYRGDQVLGGATIRRSWRPDQPVSLTTVADGPTLG